MERACACSGVERDVPRMRRAPRAFMGTVQEMLSALYELKVWLKCALYKPDYQGVCVFLHCVGEKQSATCQDAL